MDAPLGLDPDLLQALTDRLVCQAADRIFAAFTEGKAVAHRAWIAQRKGQVESMGAEAAPYYLYWIDPEGKQKSESCGPGATGKAKAERLKFKIEASLLEGTYGRQTDRTWSEFRAEFEAKIVPGLARRTQQGFRSTFGHFERLCQPGRLTSIRTAMIDGFRAARRAEGMATNTINTDCRRLQAALRRAQRWDYLTQLPAFALEREAVKEPRYVTPEHFAALYRACDQMDRPDFWRSLLVLAYLTGWRISELMALRRDQVDLETGAATLPPEDTKGKRFVRLTLHPVVIEHLRQLTVIQETWFGWRSKHHNWPWEGLHQLCKLAGVPAYTWHDFRRAFATENAERLPAQALQALMRHESYQTTARYINMARQLKAGAPDLAVPEVLKRVV
jgi:integrase